MLRRKTGSEAGFIVFLRLNNDKRVGESGTPGQISFTETSLTLNLIKLLGFILIHIWPSSVQTFPILNVLGVVSR